MSGTAERARLSVTRAIRAAMNASSATAAPASTTFEYAETTLVTSDQLSPSR